MAAVSVALAALVWRRPVHPVTAVVAAFTVGAGVLDLAEINHQIRENRTGLASLAGLIFALRLLTAAGTAELWRNPPPSGRPEKQPATDPARPVTS